MTLYWTFGGCHFLAVKTGAERYRCHRMYSTGIEEYDNPTECVVTRLQVQGDYLARQREGA